MPLRSGLYCEVRRGARRAGHRRAREHAVGLTGAGRRSRARDTFLGRGRARRLGASPRGTLADSSRTRDRGPPGARPAKPARSTTSTRRPLHHNPSLLRAASTPSRPARALERPAAVPVPSRSSHPGTRRSPRAPRARSNASNHPAPSRSSPFSRVRPTPRPHSPRRVCARCRVRPRRLGAARSLFRVVGSSYRRDARGTGREKQGSA